MGTTLLWVDKGGAAGKGLRMSASKIVCVTGCSRGLGRAMVEEFARLGWTVTGCARRGEVLAELGAKLGAAHWLGRCDVAVEAEVAAFASEVLKRHGPPDLLINNAAIINPNQPLWEMSAEDISSILDVNIKGTIAMMRHFMPAMLEKGGGVVVNFSSGWGRSTSPEVAPYCATKWAIEGLSRATAQETDGKVVGAMNPGIIDTEMLRSTFGGGAGHYPDAQKWAKKAVPFLAGLSLKDNGRELTAPS
ncbi:MAG: short-chain alcohol dehydrogenase [Verrucomicrobiaceae bacterium]|nr:short-chain alcohol dehydrogenase [Verrucomicrobiaceae bacterium]